MARPFARASSLNAPSSSSIWSGIPSVRSYTAAGTARGAGTPVGRQSPVTSRLWCAEAPSRIAPPLLWPVPDGAKKAGLAHRGLARGQQPLASARGEAVEPAVDQVEQVVATGAERTADRPHPSSHDPRV